VHHRLARIIVGLADDNAIDLGRVSFIKVLRHSRRGVVHPCSETPTKIKEFLVMLAAKVHRKLETGIRRLREANWHLKRPGSKYSSKLSYRLNTRDRRPTRRIKTKGLSHSYALAPTGSSPVAPSCDCLPHRCGNAADNGTRERRYPTDVTDAEWAVVRPLLPVPGWLQGRGGQRPVRHDHGEQDVDTSSSQGEHGLPVLFLLGPLATPQLPSPLRLDNN
jgi:hypothetical protein